MGDAARRAVWAACAGRIGRRETSAITATSPPEAAFSAGFPGTRSSSTTRSKLAFQLPRDVLVDDRERGERLAEVRRILAEDVARHMIRRRVAAASSTPPLNV